VSSGAAWAGDRGLHYGDGLFETMRFVGGWSPLWDGHRQRLATGCQRLGLPAPDWRRLQLRLGRVAADHEHSIIKLIWTAGSGPRGYARPERIRGRALIQAREWTDVPAKLLNLRWCATRLALQPALAGLKHLNRLEQVLARAEWQGTAFDEGLMLDMQGWVIAATAANLFVRHEGRWLTPELGQCGVDGVGRRWLMDQRDVLEAQLSAAQVLSADAVVLTNAVRGPRQAGNLDQRRWSVDAECTALRYAWERQFGPEEAAQ
jgi:4-amino-4-deoxychorismate lyase